jgi:predicted nucleotidyltransferase
MRLTENEITAIKTVTKSVFGEEASAVLFGSRTEDSKKGGDIDLLIKYTGTISRDDLYQLKLKFLVQLKKIIGDQKIDILIDGGQADKTIFKTVAKNGIIL